MLCQDNTNPHRDDAERPTLFRHITFFLAAAFSGAHSSQQRSRGEREKRGCIIHTQGQKKESQELWSFCVVSKFLDFLIIEGLWIESSSQPQWRYTGNRAPTMSSFPTFFHLPSPSLSLTQSIDPPFAVLFFSLLLIDVSAACRPQHRNWVEIVGHRALVHSLSLISHPSFRYSLWKRNIFPWLTPTHPSSFSSLSRPIVRIQSFRLRSLVLFVM